MALLTEQTELTTPATGDWLHVVDVSDTTSNISGTSKKITRGNFLAGQSLTNISDVTSSAAELNVLDGIPATLTATELGYVDGVTSAIQTQINTKAPTASPTFTGTVSVPATLFTVGASTPFSDSAGTLTLTNVDALDATTESTIEAAIDTLANLTSIQGQTVTLTGALIRSGAHSLTLTTTNTTSVTLPTTGTLATLAGSEEFTNKTLTAPLFQGNIDGWIAANETWTYASATTFTVPGDVTARFIKGTKIKLTQTTPKYFYVVSSTFGASTTVTVTGGTDYTLANAAITSPYYSFVDNPQAFPQWFTWSPTYTGFSAAPTGGTNKFSINGNAIQVIISTPSSGTSNATTFTVTNAPFAALYAMSSYTTSIDNGSVSQGRVDCAAASTTLSFFKDVTGAAYTNSGTKYVDRMNFIYAI